MYAKSERNLMINLIKSISDHGNVMISKAITYVGYTGVGVTTAQVASSNKSVQNAMPIAENISRTCSENPTWLIYVPAVVAATLAFKHGADFYFRLKEHKKVMNEKSTNKDNLR